MLSRRAFLQRSTVLAGVGVVSASSAGPGLNAAERRLHLACNQYVWQVFYQRDGLNLADNLDRALGEMASAGIDGFEPSVASPREIEVLSPLVRKHGLELRSLYVNSTLHEPEQIETNLRDILAIGRTAKSVGTRILVTNPSPIRWGEPQDKSDEQLIRQAQAMDTLGRELAGLGLKLAYHNHDIELRQGAREFHHMLAGTRPEWVHLCLDAHWIYRGTGNSAVALFDVLTLYGSRVCELHLRQSRAGIWTEALEDGDVDYARLAARLTDLGIRPHLVLEQAVEGASPHTMNAVAAHERTVAYARRVFASLG